MKNSPSRFALVALLGSVAASAQAATGDPVVDFFQRVGASISKAGHQQPQAAAKPSTKKNHTTATAATAKQQPAQPTASPSPPPAATTPPPTAAPMVVRSATVISDGDGKRRDLPYGVPVPNRPGFITSPYAPNQGLVDVRGIASGTEVRDPYTGKLFRTP